MEQSLVDVFRKNLKFYRTKRKFTQERLSEMLEKNANYVGLIENGKSVPPLPVIEEIARILDVRAIQLFDDEGCQENILKSGRTEFAQNLSESLSRNLRQQIHDEILRLI